MAETVERIMTGQVATSTEANAPVARRWRALARLEWGEVRRSRWLAVCGGLYAVLAGLFVLVGLRESNVLAFTGMGRVLFSLSHALVVLLPLLALSGTGPVVSRGCRDGALELLFSHPVTRDDYFVVLTVVRYGALLAPLLVLMPTLAIGGHLAFGQPVPWALLWRGLAVSAALLWAFVGLGLVLAVRIGEPARAGMYVLLLWIVAVALLDIGLVGLLLQWRAPALAVFALAAINPVETARLALLASADPTLGTLGPVGVYLADRFGRGALLVAGVAWPLIVGTVCWLLARRGFRRRDVV